MVPIAATVAGAEPEIAPKNRQATTVTIASPPVKCPTSVSKNPTRRLESPPPSMSAPLSTKNGIAINGKESQEVNIPVAI